MPGSTRHLNHERGTANLAQQLLNQDKPLYNALLPGTSGFFHMLKVFVINLVDSTTRRDNITARLNELNVEFELFEAVDGRKDPHPLFGRYDDERRSCYRRNKLSGSELGCFASHYKLWQKSIELNGSIVVMEDDVIICDEFVEALEIAMQYIDHLHYIRLSGTSLHRRPYKVVKKLDDFDLVDHVRGPAGTQCYVLHPEAATAFLNHAKVWFLAVDDYLDRYWGHAVDCYSLMPFPVKSADVESDIIRNKKESRPLTLKLKLELYGRLERMRRTKYRLSKRKIKNKRILIG